MSDIELKLEEARKWSEEYGRRYGAFTTADDYVKGIYAKLHVDAIGETVGERDAWVRRQDEYEEAVEYKKDACAAWKEIEVRMRILFAEAEVWRTTQANNRMMDGAHR